MSLCVVRPSCASVDVSLCVCESFVSRCDPASESVSLFVSLIVLCLCVSPDVVSLHVCGVGRWRRLMAMAAAMAVTAAVHVTVDGSSSDACAAVTCVGVEVSAELASVDCQRLSPAAVERHSQSRSVCVCVCVCVCLCLCLSLPMSPYVSLRVSVSLCVCPCVCM